MQNKKAPRPAAKITKPDASKDPRMVYLSNLSYARDKEGIRLLMRDLGEVLSVKIIVDMETRKSKGMAFVEMATPAQARKAIAALDGQGVDGRTLKAAPAIPQKRVLHLSAPVAEKREEKRAEKLLAPPKPKNKKVGNLHALNEYLARKGRPTVNAR